MLFSAYKTADGLCAPHANTEVELKCYRNKHAHTHTYTQHKTKHTASAGKRIAETLTMDYYREHGMDVRIVRIFNTYGPRMALDDGRVVSNFVAQVSPISHGPR